MRGEISRGYSEECVAKEELLMEILITNEPHPLRLHNHQSLGESDARKVAGGENVAYDMSAKIT